MTLFFGWCKWTHKPLLVYVGCGGAQNTSIKNIIFIFLFGIKMWQGVVVVVLSIYNSFNAH
jgi:hypothetical protein